MLTRRTTEAALLAAAFLVALFLVSCKDSESMSSPTAPGSAVVTGTVVSGDETSGAASFSGGGLAGVTVRVARTSQATQTDSAGNFTLAGVPAGDQQFEFSRGDIDARAIISVIGGATVAVTAAISRKSTVVISPRGNAKPDPHSPSQTPAQTPISGTPTPGTTPRGKTVEEIEGIVTANGGGTLTIFDQRLGSVVVTVTPTTVIRKGQTATSLGQILVGVRVHVKALLETAGTFTALEITLQDENTKTPAPPTTGTMTPTTTPAITPTP
jgi:hypothetical protein